MRVSGFYIFLGTMALCLGLTFNSLAQITESQARAYLDDKGIHEDTLRNRLINKGYDPDNIRPDQLPQFQAVVEETIREIESDNGQASIQSVPANNTIIRDTTPVVPPRPPAPSGKGADRLASLPIYGQEIFKNNSLSVFRQADQITPSDSYVIGTGDKIGVVGFGRSQFEQIMDVGPDGFIQPSGGIPRILVKGLTLGEAKELLFRRFSQYYVLGRGQFQVSVTNVRNITVNVFGEAQTTGAFTLPGFNTAFNVISAAGGPTAIGSVRNIKVISGRNVKNLDVYEFMNDPSVAKDFYLHDNDYIHIPVAQKVVQIQGAVNRPMSYELLDAENLTKLLEYAGGVMATGYLSDVQVIRYLEDRQVVTNINFQELSKGGGDYILYNGDVITIKKIEDGAYNFVTVAGAVQFPGNYEIKEGMRVSDLIAQSKLKPESRTDFAYLLRYQPDSTFRYERIDLAAATQAPGSQADAILNSRDRLEVMTLKIFASPTFFSVSGAVRNPDRFAFEPDGRLKLEDAILLAGGLSLEAADHGYVLRQDPSEPKRVEYLHVNLREAFDNPGSSENIDIRPGDRIVVYNEGVIRDDFKVNIYGEVREPGEFSYGEGMTLADLINLAGGFTFQADRNRIDIARSEFGPGENLRITQYTASLPLDFNINTGEDKSLLLQPFDHIYVRSVPEFEPQQTVFVGGEVRYPGTYAILQDNERISDLIKRAGGLTAEAFPDGAKMFRQEDSTGLVVINLNEILVNNNIASNVALQNGDVIEIPKNRDLITIGGNVNLDDAYSEGFLRGGNSISVAFRGERSAKYYIDNFAAGISEAGAPSEIKVQFANGRVEKTKKFIFFNSYPKVKRGAIITVGDKKIRPVNTEEKKEVDWGAVLRDTLTQATAVLTILILVDQLGN